MHPFNGFRGNKIPYHSGDGPDVLLPPVSQHKKCSSHTPILRSVHNIQSSFCNLTSKIYCLLSSVFILLTIAFCLLSPPATAKFDFNTNCQQTMQAILDLRLRDAQSLMEDEKKLRPDNGYVIYLEHYAQSVELIITEENALYEKIMGQFADRIKQMNRLDDGSPYNSWLQAEMYFQAGLAQVKYGSRVNGISKILSSFNKIRAHRRKYPDFQQNQKLTGTFNILLDHIPPFLKWAADLFGYGGNSDLGLYQLQNYFNHVKTIPGLAEEAAMFSILGYKMNWQNDDGFRFAESLDQNILNNTLVRYLHATAATFVYRNDLAMELLSKIQQSKLQVKFYSLDYLTGKSKLNHLEDDAGIYLEKYLTNYPGLDYKKDASNRLSYHYLIRNDQLNYEKFRSMVASVGQELRERDKEAMLESTAVIMPHVGLLKARLLCDGGYFDEALAMISSIDPDGLDEISYRLEYHYRIGRIRQLTLHTKEALEAHTKAYDEGKSHPYTFAARAALQLAKIWEQEKDYARAYEWYNRCLTAYSSAHTTEGVKEMASKGAKRLKGRF